MIGFSVSVEAETKNEMSISDIDVFLRLYNIQKSENTLKGNGSHSSNSREMQVRITAPELASSLRIA